MKNKLPFSGFGVLFLIVFVSIPKLYSQEVPQKKFVEISGKKMAYVDLGKGVPIIFFHGNPTSSYLWRNVMPHLKGRGRCIAFDLMGMGDSDKIDSTDLQRYTLKSHQYFVNEFLKELKIKKAILVAHDWGGALAIDWARKNPDKVVGIAFMETFLDPFVTGVSKERDAEVDWFKAFRTYRMEDLVLNENYFVEQVLFAPHNTRIDDKAKAEYRRPFRALGEDRLPTLLWPRQVAINGDPSHTKMVLETNREFMSSTKIPKLFIGATPGGLMKDYEKNIIRTWPALKEVNVKGNHFIQEQSPDEIGVEIMKWIEELQLRRKSK